MIIKSMSRKNGGFLPLLAYINKDEQRENNAIFHNLRTDPDDINIIAQEFAENARYSPQRKNGVVCYHEILSFQGQHAPETFADIARAYLELRAPESLAYAKLHTDTAHPHIHFCISANLIKQKKKNRLSRADFKQVKEKLRIYVKTRYPELNIIPLSTPQKVKKSPANKSPKQKRGQTIKKELVEKILEIFALAKNLEEVTERLSRAEIEGYQRGKQAFYGVIYQGKKYRFSTLGVKEKVQDRLAVWERTEKRLRELETIKQAKAKIREKTKAMSMSDR